MSDTGLIPRLFEIGKFTDRDAFDGMIDSLTMDCMKVTYIDMVTAYGTEVASQRMGNLFGSSWEKGQTDIWQWYDHEVEYLKERV